MQNRTTDLLAKANTMFNSPKLTHLVDFSVYSLDKDFAAEYNLYG